MLGEEVNTAAVTDRGVVGDRAYALVDVEYATVAVSGEMSRSLGNRPETTAPEQ
jgi:hypothetical protein